MATGFASAAVIRSKESELAHDDVHLNGQVGEWLPRQPQWQHCGLLQFTNVSTSLVLRVETGVAEA